MEGGPPRFIPGFTCPALLGIPLSGPRSFGYGALTLYRPASQPVPLDRGFLTRPRRSSDGTEGPTTPRAATPGGLHAHGFRLLRFRSPLLAQSRLISFPPGTERFQFPGLPRAGLCIQPAVAGLDPSRVPPFGDPRVEGCLPLTAAYRSLPRPSSASYAKASTVCP